MAETLEVPKASQSRQTGPVAAAFAAGVAVALACVLVGFWMGRSSQTRIAGATKSGAPARVPANTAPPASPSAQRQPLTARNTAGPSLEGEASPNGPAGAKPPASVPASSSALPKTSGVNPGVLRSQAAAAPLVTASGPPRRAFVIEMSPLPTPEKATEMAAVLKNLGYGLSQASEDSPPHGAPTHIEVGPYASRDDAELAMSKMRLEGLHPASVIVVSTPDDSSGASIRGAATASDTSLAAESKSATEPLVLYGATARARQGELPPLPPAVANGFAVQVEAWKSRDAAERSASSLKSLGYPASVVPPGSEDHDPLFRVQVGFYATASQARVVRDRLRKRGLRPFIKQPSISESASAGSSPSSPAAHP